MFIIELSSYILYMRGYGEMELLSEVAVL